MKTITVAIPLKPRVLFSRLAANHLERFDLVVYLDRESLADDLFTNTEVNGYWNEHIRS